MAKDERAGVASLEDLEAALSAGAKVEPVEAPTFFASGIRVGVSPTECNLTFQRGRPAQVVRDGQVIADVGTMENVAVIQMSVGGLKDLTLLLQQQIAKYEDDWGPIETEFSRARDKKA